MITLEEIRKACGGKIVKGKVMTQAPGHKAKDRSLSIRPHPTDRYDIVVHSFAGEDWRTLKAWARVRLGLPEMPEWNPSGDRTIKTTERPASADHPPRQTASPTQQSVLPTLPTSPEVVIPDMTPLQQGDRWGLQAIGEPEPPHVAGELPGRRHAYRRNGEVVRMKIKKEKGGAFIDFYRVRNPETREVGWQAQKPDGYAPVPYVRETDPFDAELATDTVFWPEGEKDVDTCGRLGVAAFTFGGSNDVPTGCGSLLKGRDVVILVDNDQPGRDCAERKVAECLGHAERIRVVHFPDVRDKGDVSDWIETGHTVEDLLERVATEAFEVPKPRPLIAATPYVWIVPRAIPPRAWVYGRHYIRKFISTTAAPGGVGKSSLTLTEALAIAVNRPILGVRPAEQTHVWVWNGEDPLEEMQRRIAAAVLHHGINPADLQGRLYIDSGREMPIVVVTQTRAGTTIAEPLVEAIKATIREQGIGVLIIDPFVSCHEVNENDNGAINAVATVWAQIADETSCAIELVHHTRKGQGGEATVEDGRGAVALLNKARCARVINVMNEKEAEAAAVEERRIHFRTYGGKANLAPPSDTSTWFRLASVDLGNGAPGQPSDEVGAVESWAWPNPFDGVTIDQVRAIQHKLSGGEYREDAQAKEWAGYVVAEVLRLDTDKKADLATVKGLLKGWLREDGALTTFTKRDAKGTVRSFIKVGAWV